MKYLIIFALFFVSCTHQTPQSNSVPSPEPISEEASPSPKTLSPEEASQLIEEMKSVTLKAVKMYREEAKKDLRDRAVIKLIKTKPDEKVDNWYVKEEVEIEKKVIQILLDLAKKETKWRDQIGISWKEAEEK